MSSHPNLIRLTTHLRKSHGPISYPCEVGFHGCDGVEPQRKHIHTDRDIQCPTVQEGGSCWIMDEKVVVLNKIYVEVFGICENRKLCQTLNWFLVLVLLSCDFICGGCSARVAAG